MALSQTLTNVSASTNTNIYTATADKVLKVRIVNNTSNEASISLCISTTSVTQQTSGRIVPDNTLLPALSFMEITGIGMTTANEFLVLNSSQAVNTVVDATEI
jgi:hypothetical protein